MKLRFGNAIFSRKEGWQTGGKDGWDFFPPRLASVHSSVILPLEVHPHPMKDPFTGVNTASAQGESM